MKLIMNKKFLPFLFLPVLLMAISCDRVEKDPLGDEMARFNAWVDVNNLSSYKTPSGLYYINQVEGTGDSPRDSDIIVYKYINRNLDGYIYNNTYKDTAKLYDIYGLYKSTTHYVPVVKQYFSKNSTPRGLIEGLGKMKVGGKARLIMPSSLAYGKDGYGQIPSYTSLIWDIELVNVFHGTIAEYEQSLIDKYVTDNGFTPLNDTLYYKQKVAGVDNGGVKKDSIVAINYIGRFLNDGFIFDTNIKQVALDSNIYNSSRTYSSWSFRVGSTSKYDGVDPPKLTFQSALTHMKEGETSYFLFPSKYMYGADGNTTGATIIPAYTPLVFEIQLVTVKPK